MTEGPGPAGIPPKPLLPPKRLKAERRRRERRAEHEQRRAEKKAHRAARKASKDDVAHFHGHQVISSRELREVFSEADAALDRVRFRHRLIHGVTLSLLAIVLIAAAVVALMISQGIIRLPAAESRASPGPSCPVATFDYAANTSIHLKVYNSTKREGLAATVAAELTARGYQVDSVANKETNYAGTAVVTSGPAGQAAAFNLQRNIPGTDFVQDQRTDSSVDVYLTPGFTALVETDKVDQTPGQLSCPRLSPSPVPASSVPSGGPAPSS